MPGYLDVFVAPLRDSESARVAVMAVLLLTMIDILFGVVNALVHREFSSQKMREGIGHKSASLGFMMVGCIIDGTIVGGLDLGFVAPVLVTACSYLSLMEVASLCETFGRLNPQFVGNPVYQLLATAHMTQTAETEER